MYQTQLTTYTDAVPDVPKSAMTSIEALPNVTDSFMTYIEDLPNVTDSFMTYIEAVPELETGINTGLCYRRDQAACVPWVASIFALCKILASKHINLKQDLISRYLLSVTHGSAGP